MRIFDVNNSGSIDFQVKKHKNCCALAQNSLQEYASLHKFLLSMQSTFAMGDKDKNGRLDSQEIHTALLAGGFKMSYQTRLVPALLPEERCDAQTIPPVMLCIGSMIVLGMG